MPEWNDQRFRFYPEKCFFFQSDSNFVKVCFYGIDKTSASIQVMAWCDKPLSDKQYFV